MNEHPQIKTLEYNYIADGIYIGTNQCCQTHFDEKLKKEGITVDISLEEERIDTPFGIEFYIWIPIKNHTAPTQDQLDFGVSTLEKLVAMKKKIYVHCQNGHGRAPTLVAAYLIKQGKSPDEAIAFIKAKRSSIHLEDGQKESLVEFSKRINQTPMTLDKIIVTLAGLVGIAFTYWFFLKKKDKEIAVSGSVDIVVEGGYSPNVISIPKGKTTKLNFIRKDPSSCLEEVVLGDFKIRKYLPLNQKVAVELTPRQTGEFTYSCGMNMFHGKIIVK